MWRILYLDDEEDIREIARMSLELADDMDVALLGKPQEAVETVRRFRPDLMLLDFRMPGMDGLEVLRRLQAEPDCADLSVVFMTASVQKQEIQALLDAGAIGVIQKPFDPMMLGSQVRCYLPATAGERGYDQLAE